MIDALLLQLSLWGTLSANLPHKHGLVGLDEGGLPPEDIQKVVFWHFPGVQVLVLCCSISSNNIESRV